MARVTVVIPTWNRAELLDDALRSLRDQTFRDFEVVVVDNASDDGTQEMLEAEHPDARVVVLPENLGFAAAVNAGIRSSTSEIVALLNNDTEVHPAWLAELVRALDEDPEAGSCASKMLDFHDRSRIDSAGDRLGVFASQRGHGSPDGPEFAERRYVLSACAGAAAYRRELFERVGLFDERYFAYFEDVDLGVRARLAGYRCLYVPTAVVYHRGSATGRRISERAFHLKSRNSLILGFQYLPATRLLLFGGVLVVWPFVRALADGHRLGTALRAVRDFLADLPEVLRRRRAAFSDPRASRAGLPAELAAPWARSRSMPRGLPEVDEPRPDADRPVDVIVVSWNGRRWLPDCLAALQRSTLPLHVIVVDNASADGSADYVRKHHPGVELLALTENTGYSAGANAGLGRARGDFALIMNPDALVEPEYVERLVDRMRATPTIGIAQGRLHQLTPEEFTARSGTSQDEATSSSGDGSARTLDSAGHVVARDRRVLDRAQGGQDGPAFDRAASVFSASGAALMLRRAMWEDVAPGGEVFDEGFFAYKEDIDLCWRARWLGWEVAYVPEARAGHVRAWGGRGLPPKDRISLVARRHSWKNHYLLMAKNDRLGHIALHLPWILAWEIVRQGYALLRDPLVYGAYPELARRLPGALRARRDLFRRRRAEPSEMRRWFGSEPRPLEAVGARADSSVVGA